MNTIDIGSKIKKLRSKKSIEIGKKYTGAMLANELGISRSYLGDIESGRTVPNEIILGKIADIFDVDIYELIGDDKDISIDNSNVIELKYSKKVTDTIRKIDDNAAIKKYIKDTLLDRHIQNSIQQGIFMYKRVNDVRFIKGKQEAI